MSAPNWMLDRYSTPLPKAVRLFTQAEMVARIEEFRRVEFLIELSEQRAHDRQAFTQRHRRRAVVERSA